MANKNEKLTFIAKNIAKFRKQKKLSQTQLAIKLNISREHIAKIETGLRHPSLPLVIDIAETLNIETKDLFDFK